MHTDRNRPCPAAVRKPIGAARLLVLIVVGLILGVAAATVAAMPVDPAPRQPVVAPVRPPEPARHGPAGGRTYEPFRRIYPV